MTLTTITSLTTITTDDNPPAPKMILGIANVLRSIIINKTNVPADL